MFIRGVFLFGLALSNYFLGVPYQGIMNQMNCLFRAASICIHGNRTLIVPPIITQDDIGRALYIMPNIYLNFKHVFHGLSYVYWNDFYTSNITNNIPIILHDRWKNSKMLGNQANTFIRSHFSKEWTLYSSNLTKFSRSKEIIQEFGCTHQRVIAFGNLQHTKAGLEAIRLLERMSFTKYLQRVVHSIKSRFPFTLRSYTTVHWRRGDFKRACLKNKIFYRCLPDAQYIHSLTNFSRILIATNESEPDELKGLREMFYLLGDHEKITDNLATQLFSDFYFMLDSTQFIGNSYSSISRNAAILRLFLNKTTTFF